MSTNFLDKFRSGLKAIQGRQMMALLTREKDRGSITSLEEFKARLSELTQKLGGTKLTPSFEIFLAKVGDLIDSDSFNFMLERIEDDLSAAFQEANEIDEILNSHETIINNVVLSNLELALNSLEAELDSIEFLNNTSMGFNSAVFNTFRVTQNNRSSASEGVIFFDPKTNLQSGPRADAHIDFVGEKLILKNNASRIPISSVRQIFDSEAVGTELNVEFEDNSLSSITDTSPGSFWVQSTLLSSPRGEAGVKTKLELNLASVQTLNHLQLEPINLYNLFLYRIDYLDENNQLKTVLSNPLEINSGNKFFFSTISTRKLILVFQNKSFFETQFEQKPEDPLNLSRKTNDSSALLDSIKSEVLEVVGSPVMRDRLGVNNLPARSQKKYYEYLVGFNNIEIGYSIFEENSIFVSKTEKIVKMGQAALKVLDKRPVASSGDSSDIEYTTETNPLETDSYFHGSLEYYLIKRDFGVEGSLLNSFAIPLLPMNVSVIRHERLFLKYKTSTSMVSNNIGLLQFYTDQDINQILVYRNGQLLTPTDLGTINPLETDGWLLNASFGEATPGAANRMSIAIQIQKPNPNDIYTVSYTPNIGTSRKIPLDLATTISQTVDTSGKLDSWLGPNNITFFPSVKKGKEIDYSLVNLVIVLRRNSSNVTLTPVVEEYTLASSSIKNNKFG